MKYFDLHCDTVAKIYDENKEFDNRSLSVNRFCALHFSEWYQCFAVFIDDNIQKPFEYYNNCLSVYNDKILKNKPENLFPVLTVEGGRLIENDLSRIETLKKDGVFALTLTWNGENQIAGGAKSDADLKPFGKEVIKELNRYKISADLSHLNSKSFYKAVEIADFPIATHSCVYEVKAHNRNLTFDRIKLISEKNGIVGLCLFPEFLGSSDVYEQFYRNVCFCLNKGFEDSVAIGSDFDGCDTPLNANSIPELYKYLLNKNISENVLNKLFFKNAYNYFKQFDK